MLIFSFHKSAAGKQPGLLKVLSVNLAVLIVLLFLGEMIFRMVHFPFDPQKAPSENAIARFDRDLGWAYLPDIAKNVNFGNSVKPVFTNEQGIRVPAQGYKFSPTAPSVLFIGCSFTMGHGLSYEESFVGQFASLPGNPWQTVNLGVQGYGTDQSLLALEKFAPAFNTKVVVYTFIDDHVIRNGNHDRRLLYPRLLFLGTKPLFGLNDKQELVLEKKPSLYRDYHNSYLWDAVRMKVGPLLGLFPPHPEKLTHELIRQMNNYCRERGIRFVMLNWRLSKAGYNNFGGLGVEVIDSLENAPADWPAMREPGGPHPNAEGGRHIVELLRDHLRRM